MELSLLDAQPYPRVRRADSRNMITDSASKGESRKPGTINEGDPTNRVTTDDRHGLDGHRAIDKKERRGDGVQRRAFRSDELEALVQSVKDMNIGGRHP